VIVVPAPASTPPRTQLQASPAINALVIDRQPLFQAALANLLEAPPLCARVLSATRSDAGLEIVRAGSVELVFCELHAEPVSGVDLVETLAREGHAVPVILLGDEGDEPQLAAALATNVAGVFTKSAALEEFLVGVGAVVSGHRAIGSTLMGRLVERLAPPLAHESKRGGNRLSPTELEILTMVGQAHSIPAIAASRGISHKTVRNHLAKIYRKLELHGRTEAMLWAARMGLTGN
jgi:DNA-binding NarL/FixJ family response regulator